MASKGNFFSKFLSFILVLIIIGGVGFLGYNLLLNNGGMNMNSMTTGGNNETDTAKNSNTNDSSSNDNMNMDESTNNNTNDAQYSTTVINVVLQNKVNLEKTIETLNETLKLMTFDPYGVAENQQSNEQNQTTNEIETKDVTTNETGIKDGTTINIYPQNVSGQVDVMQSMGIKYDAAKMEKLHTGLYKVSIGMQLLEQLKNNLSSQLEQASMQIINPSQYYYNQYLITVQNKTKLTEALTYINEAGTLLNINPYISQDGAVYDKDRMSNIHDSVYKLAQVVVDLNMISDNFSKQAITLGNETQSYLNNSQSMQNMNMADTGTNIFGNVSAVTVFNILMIVFVFVFIISILGYIGGLLKSPRNNNSN